MVNIGNTVVAMGRKYIGTFKNEDWVACLVSVDLKADRFELKSVDTPWTWISNFVTFSYYWKLID